MTNPSSYREQVLSRDRGLGRKVAKGARWSLIAWFASLATTAPMTVALVRSLPRETYGNLAIATSTIALVTVIADFGLASATAQLSARKELEAVPATNSLARPALQVASYAAVVTAIAVAIIACGMYFASLPTVAILILIMLPIAVVVPIVSVLSGLLQSIFAVGAVTVAGGVQSLIIAVGTGSVLLSGAKSDLAIAGLRVAGSLSALVILVIGARGFWTRPRQNPIVSAKARKKITSDILRIAGAMWLSGLAWAAISQLDVVILGLLRGSRAAASYGPISNVANTVAMLPAVIGSFLLPALSRAVADRDSRTVKALYYGASRWSIAICAPAIGLLIAVPGELLGVLFGSAYVAYGPACRILAIGVSAHVLIGYNGLTLDAHGEPKLVAKRAVTGLVGSALCCPLLINAFGINGAAAATALAMILINLQCSWTLARRFFIAPFDKWSAFVVLAFGGSSLCIAWIFAPRHKSALTLVVAASVIGGVTAIAAFGAHLATNRYRTYGASRALTS